jgi:hypothetical protein
MLLPACAKAANFVASIAQAIEQHSPRQSRNPMKKTDLYKNEGLKINGQMKQAGTPDRFGSAASAAVSRRDQRKLEQAQGLVAFAVKLDGELVKQIHALAEARQTGINETVAALLVKGLADGS